MNTSRPALAMLDAAHRYDDPFAGARAPAVARIAPSAIRDCLSAMRKSVIAGRRSLRLNVCRFDDRAPALGLLLDEGRHLGRRAAARGGVERLIALEQLGAMHRLVGRVIEFGDDRGRRFWRRRDGVPGVGFAT